METEPDDERLNITRASLCLVAYRSQREAPHIWTGSFERQLVGFQKREAFESSWAPAILRLRDRTLRNI